MSILRKVACAAVLLSSSAAAQISLFEEHGGGWTSGVGQDEVELRFSAAIVAPAEGALVALAFDRFSGACGAAAPSLTIAIPSPSTQSIALIDQVGFMRVDENPIRTMKFNARVQEGDTLIYMDITRVLGHDDFLGELRRGRTLRFKLGTERSTYYMRFSLIGFTVAAARSQELCRQHDQAFRGRYPVRQPKPRGPEDRDYFEE